MKLVRFLVILIGVVGITGTANATLIYNIGGCDATSDPGGTGSCGGSGADIPLDALVVTFMETSTDNVQMTLDASAMPVGLGKIKDVWVNVDGFDFSQLSFSYNSGVETESIIAGGNVGSLGSFDVDFQYSTSGSLGDFYYGLTSVYTIHASGLTESAFASTNSDGFSVAMKLNDTGNGNSGHYAAAAPVPEPATMLLFGTGLVGLVGARFRRKK